MGREKLPEIPANASKSWHEVVERPNDLAKKVPRTGGIEPEKAFEAAETVVKQMTSDYVDKLAEDIEQMKRLAAKYREDNSDATLDQLFRLVHNMRGQGATFGFPLITEIGRHFCRYVRERPKGKAVKPALVDQHLKALLFIDFFQVPHEGVEFDVPIIEIR